MPEKILIVDDSSDSLKIAKARLAKECVEVFCAEGGIPGLELARRESADDYLTKPTHPTELQAHVKALLARTNKAKTNPPTGPIVDSPAYVIGVIAARGGMGVTTVACNLAAALRKKTDSNVILAEFRPGQGTLLGNPASAAGVMKS